MTDQSGGQGQQAAPSAPHVQPREECDGDPSGPGLRLTGRRLRHEGRQFRPAIGLTATIAVAVTVTRVAQAVLVARVLGHVLEGRGPVAPALMAAVAVAGIRLPLLGLQARLAVQTAGQATDHLRGRLVAHLMELGPGFLVHRRTGGIETASVDGTERLGHYYGEFVPQAIAAIVSVAAVLAWIAVLDPVTALVMVGAALLVALAPTVTARAFGETGRKFASQLGGLASDYLDAVQGMLTLKAFNATPAWGRGLAERSEELSADATALAAIATMHIGFVSLGMAVGTTLAAALATLRATDHLFSASALLTIVLLARECFRPLGELQGAIPAAYQAAAGANTVFELLDREPETAEAPHPVDIEPDRLVPSIVFDEVTFSYRDDRPPALDGVSFEIAPGETVALVGPSGAGKSTAVSLLLRFFDPPRGSVRIGGHDVRTLRLCDLRSLVAVMLQDSYVFHASVRDNLLLARPGASLDDIEVAARAANAHHFIAALPDGYDTVIGERGALLSGGERQRLSLARALLRPAPIVVLDEPTASVDAASEQLITASLQRLSGVRTTLIVAHRLSTVERADRVLVLDGGRVVQSGPPRALGDKAGLFAHLVGAEEPGP